MLLKYLNKNKKRLDELVEKGEGNVDEIPESFVKKRVKKKIKERDFDYLSELQKHFPNLQPDKYFIQHVYRNIDFDSAKKLFDLYGIKPKTNLTNTVENETKEFDAELISAKEFHCPFFKNKYIIKFKLAKTHQTIKREIPKEEFYKHDFNNFSYYSGKKYKVTLPIFTDYNIEGNPIRENYISESPQSKIVHISKS